MSEIENSYEEKHIRKGLIIKFARPNIHPFGYIKNSKISSKGMEATYNSDIQVIQNQRNEINYFKLDETDDDHRLSEENRTQITKDVDQQQPEETRKNEEIQAVPLSTKKKSNLDAIKLLLYKNDAKLALLVPFMPLIAMIYCITVWINNDEERIHANFCGKNQVTNFWPALSDAISTSTSTILVWNILIWLIVPIRFMSAEYLDRTYKRIYNSRSDLSHLAHNRCFQRVIKITYCVHMFEIICLFVLSVIPVNLHNIIHRLATCLFVFSDFFFTLFVCWIEYKLKLKKNISIGSKKFNFYSLRYLLSFINVAGFTIMVVAYDFYKLDCVSYVYSIFGLSEIVFLLGNAFFVTFTYFIIHDFYIVEELKEVAI